MVSKRGPLSRTPLPNRKFGTELIASALICCRLLSFIRTDCGTILAGEHPQIEPVGSLDREAQVHWIERPWNTTLGDGGLVYRSGSLMRFLPKWFASTDQAPGPSIASPAPNTADSMSLQRFPGRHKAAHNSIIAATPPAIGVHNPAARNSPTAASINSFRKWWGDSTSPVTPSWNNATAGPSRRQRSPIPGQPLAKVENKRCRNGSRLLG